MQRHINGITWRLAVAGALTAIAVIPALSVPAAAKLPAPDAGLPAKPATVSGGMDMMPANKPVSTLAKELAAGRAATAKYALNLNRAKKDGYQILTPMMPDMGVHYLNPAVTGFDIRKPPILVYVKSGTKWQLVAFEWVFPSKPDKPPLPGAKYGSFGAACHYKDGNFVFKSAESKCPKKSKAGAAFNFWHPKLVTLHVWLWYPNPSGIYHGTNPLIRPYNTHDRH